MRYLHCCQSKNAGHTTISACALQLFVSDLYLVRCDALSTTCECHAYLHVLYGSQLAAAVSAVISIRYWTWSIPLCGGAGSDSCATWAGGAGKLMERGWRAARKQSCHSAGSQETSSDICTGCGDVRCMQSLTTTSLALARVSCNSREQQTAWWFDWCASFCTTGFIGACTSFWCGNTDSL